MKRAFSMQQKAYFIILKGALLKQIKTTFLEGESVTLILQAKFAEDPYQVSFW